MLFASRSATSGAPNPAIACTDSTRTDTPTSAAATAAGRLVIHVHARPAGTNSTTLRMNWLLPNGSERVRSRPVVDQSVTLPNEIPCGHPPRRRVTATMSETEASDANSAPNGLSVRPDRRNHHVNIVIATSKTTSAGNACVSAIELTSEDAPSTASNPVSSPTLENSRTGAP